MKINELLEAVDTPEGEANKLHAEFQEILDDAGVAAYRLNYVTKRDNKSKGTSVRTVIHGFIIPKIENDEYDADEAEITLRLAHRLISKWLDQKEADGQSVRVNHYSSDVGEGRKFSTRLHTIWTGSNHIEVPSFYVTVSIVSKEDTSMAN
jgi:hypothetical protein